MLTGVAPQETLSPEEKDVLTKLRLMDKSGRETSLYIINKEYNIYSGLDKYMYLNNEIDTNNLTYEYEGIEDLTKETYGNYYVINIPIKKGEVEDE